MSYLGVGSTLTLISLELSYVIGLSLGPGTASFVKRKKPTLALRFIFVNDCIGCLLVSLD